LRRVLCMFAITMVSCAPGYTQQTVGNGTVTLPSEGQKESYGLNDQAPNQNGSVFPTRHYGRANNNSGIGGSTVGTESVTSESSPAQASITNVRTSAIQFSLPKLDSGTIVNFGSPALGSFTPALPAVPGSSALSSPFSPSNRFVNSPVDVESMPSFNYKQRSVTDMMQFDKFGSFK
jgi:hypothetical protein